MTWHDALADTPVGGEGTGSGVVVVVVGGGGDVVGGDPAEVVGGEPGGEVVGGEPGGEVVGVDPGGHVVGGDPGTVEPVAFGSVTFGPEPEPLPPVPLPPLPEPPWPPGSPEPPDPPPEPDAPPSDPPEPLPPCSDPASDPPPDVSRRIRPLCPRIAMTDRRSTKLTPFVPVPEPALAIAAIPACPHGFKVVSPTMEPAATSAAAGPADNRYTGTQVTKPQRSQPGQRQQTAEPPDRDR